MFIIKLSTQLLDVKSYYQVIIKVIWELLSSYYQVIINFL